MHTTRQKNNRSIPTNRRKQTNLTLILPNV
jgi:hypothetical protein